MRRRRLSWRCLHSSARWLCSCGSSWPHDGDHALHGHPVCLLRHWGPHANCGLQRVRLGARSASTLEEGGLAVRMDRAARAWCRRCSTSDSIGHITATEVDLHPGTAVDLVTIVDLATIADLVTAHATGIIALLARAVATVLTTFGFDKVTGLFAPLGKGAVACPPPVGEATSRLEVGSAVCPPPDSEATSPRSRAVVCPPPAGEATSLLSVGGAVCPPPGGEATSPRALRRTRSTASTTFGGSGGGGCGGGGTQT